MNEEFISNIGIYSVRSILYEVSATPKPGLVDRNNCGAHNDMDFFTFIDSVSVLNPYFCHCTRAGMYFKGFDYTQLMKDIRPLGIKAEKDMFKATKGINTHKGMVFSIGIICAAAGSLYSEFKKDRYSIEQITNRVMDITKGITRELDNIDKNRELTYGESLYKRYGVKGIRGEVEEGFVTVRSYGYPELQRLLSKREEKNYKLNDILIQVLLNLMANTEDSNVLGRHDMNTLRYVQSESKKALELGGSLTDKGMEYIKNMDKDFISKNISSGGAADLLSVSLILYLIETGDI